MSYTPFTILTSSGVYFDLGRPRPEDVRARDIAESHSRFPRFTGHSSVGRSIVVGQHCLNVMYALRRDFPDEPMLHLEGLLHDASEAYTGDISSPMKRLLGPYLKLIEHPIQNAIMDHFELPRTPDPRVKLADLEMLMTERAVLFPGSWNAEHEHHWRASAFGDLSKVRIDDSLREGIQRQLFVGAKSVKLSYLYQLGRLLEATGRDVALAAG